MAGLTGKSAQGVGHDIVAYLTEVALYFKISIRVTSGYRDPDGQAKAMFDNWAKMKHGRIYKKSTLPEEDRARLDLDWTRAQNAKATAEEKKQAESDFLELAKSKVGKKSMHSRGRAIDVARANIDQKVYRAITMHLHEVKEGDRTDIYHFESQPVVPTVDEAMRTSWQDLDHVGHYQHKPSLPAHGVWC